ncbi:MAG: NlpC/P60 family protein [Thermodesulfobacteriota bacterium]
MKAAFLRRETGNRESAVRRTTLVLLALLLLAAGCAAKPPSREKPVPARKELVRTGFSIQAGAFSNVQNAMRLTETLERQGLCAYYFRHISGLFKVRFGDYATEREARAQAESLVKAGIIEEFYITNPGEYAIARLKADGVMGLRKEIVATAEGFIGIPYQWGGTSPGKGFDCSGLTMAVYQMNGLNLPRTSGDQFASGNPVNRSDMVKGDLVFFAITAKQKPTHVGLYTGDGRFIHAPGRGKAIRADSLSDSYFASHFLGARTYL